MSRDYESKAASATKARALLGDRRFHLFHCMHMAQMAFHQANSVGRDAKPLARRAARLHLAAQAISEAVRRLEPSEIRLLALTQAREASATLERLSGTLAALAKHPGDLVRGGYMPAVAPKPRRPEFITRVLAHDPSARSEVDPRAWAYFAIGAGLEPVVKADAVRSAQEVFHVRCAAWGSDLAAQEARKPTRAR